jgi:hypothetical protein
VKSAKASLKTWSRSGKACRLAILGAWQNALGGGYLGRISCPFFSLIFLYGIHEAQKRGCRYH